MPPFGHSTQLRVFVDPDLLQYDVMRVAGGVVTDLKRYLVIEFIAAREMTISRGNIEKFI